MFAKLFATPKRFKRRHVPVVDGVRAGRVELHCRETTFDFASGNLSRRHRILVERSRVDVFALGGRRIEIRVATELVVDSATEQLVDGFADGLATDVPARHLDTRQHRAKRHVGAKRVTRPIGIAPHAFDVERIRANKPTLDHVLGHVGNNLRGEGRGVDLAVTHDAVVGYQLHEDEVAAPKMGRRVADNKGFELSNLHGNSLGENIWVINTGVINTGGNTGGKRTA